MPTPNADGPDIAGSYQTITGWPIDPNWSLFSHKAAEGQQTHDRRWRVRWPWMRDQSTLRYRCLYHWVRSDSTPKAQAEHALRIMAEAEFGQPGDIWQTDWETTPNIPLMTSLQVAEYNDRIRQGLGEDRVITYSSDWLPDSTLDADTRGEFYEWREENPDDAYWHANYNTTNKPHGGWAEIDKYDAAVWQFTSRYTHPSISSTSAGFDMNHVRDFATLDRIAGYDKVIIPPDTEEHPDMFVWSPKGFANAFLIGAGPAIWLSPAAFVQLVDVDGLPTVLQDPHKGMLKSALFQAGLDDQDLEPLKS